MSSASTSRAASGRGNKDKMNKETTQQNNTKTEGQTKMQPTAEQMRIAQMISNNEDPELYRKIDQIKELTNKGEDEVTIALHDAGYDTEKAVNILLEEHGQGEWKESGKKRKKPTPSAPSKPDIITNHIDDKLDKREQSKERDQNQNDRPEGGPSRRTRRPGIPIPRLSRGRGRDRDRGGDRFPENGDWDQDNEGSKERSSDRGRGRGRGESSGRGMDRGRGGRGRGRGGGSGSGRGGGFRTGRFDKDQNQPVPQIGTWSNETAANAEKENNQTWGEFPATEDWNDEAWTGGLEETKIFTAKTQPMQKMGGIGAQSPPSITTQSVIQPPNVMTNNNLQTDLSAPLNDSTNTFDQRFDLQAFAKTVVVPDSSISAESSYITQFKQQATESIKNTIGIGSSRSPVSSYQSVSQHVSTMGNFSSLQNIHTSQDNDRMQMSLSPTQSQSPITTQSLLQQRAKPLKSKQPPPSKIPASAVEMPGHIMPSQEAQFSLEFGFGSDSTPFAFGDAPVSTYNSSTNSVNANLQNHLNQVTKTTESVISSSMMAPPTANKTAMPSMEQTSPRTNVFQNSAYTSPTKKDSSIGQSNQLSSSETSSFLTNQPDLKTSPLMTSQRPSAHGQSANSLQGSSLSSNNSEALAYVQNTLNYQSSSYQSGHKPPGLVVSTSGYTQTTTTAQSTFPNQYQTSNQYQTASNQSNQYQTPTNQYQQTQLQSNSSQYPSNQNKLSAFQSASSFQNTNSLYQNSNPTTVYQPSVSSYHSRDGQTSSSYQSNPSSYQGQGQNKSFKNAQTGSAYQRDAQTGSAYQRDAPTNSFSRDTQSGSAFQRDSQSSTSAFQTQRDATQTANSFQRDSQSGSYQRDSQTNSYDSQSNSFRDSQTYGRDTQSTGFQRDNQNVPYQNDSQSSSSFQRDTHSVPYKLDNQTASFSRDSQPSSFQSNNQSVAFQREAQSTGSSFTRDSQPTSSSAFQRDTQTTASTYPRDSQTTANSYKRESQSAGNTFQRDSTQSSTSAFTRDSQTSSSAFTRDSQSGSYTRDNQSSSSFSNQTGASFPRDTNKASAAFQRDTTQSSSSAAFPRDSSQTNSSATYPRDNSSSSSSAFQRDAQSNVYQRDGQSASQTSASAFQRDTTQSIVYQRDSQSASSFNMDSTSVISTATSQTPPSFTTPTFSASSHLPNLQTSPLTAKKLTDTLNSLSVNDSSLENPTSQIETSSSATSTATLTTTVSSVSSLTLGSTSATSTVSTTNVISSKMSTMPATSTGKSKAPPNLPPGGLPLVGPQYILGQANLPFYGVQGVQQPVYPSFEDLQMLQSRMPVANNYYDMGFVPTSLPARDQTNIASVPFTGTDNKLTRVEAQSPVPSSQQATSQTTHQQQQQQPYINLHYGYYYPSVLPNAGGFQYPMFPAMTPVTNTPAAHAGTTANAQYQKTYASGYGSNKPYDDLTQTTDFTKTPYGTSQTKVVASPSAVGVGSVTSDISYGKSHTQAFDKQGYHGGTPPPFNMQLAAAAASQSGPLGAANTPYGTPPYAMMPHQALQAHYPTLQDATGVSRSTQPSSSVTKGAATKNYSNSYW